MSRKLNQRTLSVRLTVASIAGYLFATGVMLAFAYWAMAAIDDEALRRQVGFARQGLSTVLGRVAKEQESITIWSDSVLQARAGNQEWMRDNVGQWVAEYFGHDAAYVLDAEGRPIHAYRNGETRPAEVFAADAHVVAPLFASLRARVTEAGAGLEDISPVVGEFGERDIAIVDGLPTAISIKPIVGSDGNLAVPLGNEFFHVSMRQVDQDVLAEVAAMYDLQGLRLLPSGEHADSKTAIPIKNAVGRVLGLLGWKGDRPGTQLVLTAAPGVGGAIVLGAIGLAFLLLRLRRSSTELHASEAHNQFLAFHDTLTGLPNRALFEDRLERALVTAHQSGKRVALHAIDIDHFKNINDTRGHPAGDELICQVGARLTSALRGVDTVARLGGDEFAVVQVEVADLAEAERAAEAMIEAVREAFDLFGERAHVTASVGLVLSSGADSNFNEMMRKADIALYEAKGAGRDRFEVFAGDMDDLIKRRRLVEDELRLALELGSQLKLVYQPLFDPSGTRILGAEALVRWDHPVHGRMSPDLFISIAEDRALIEPLGDFVLREATRFALESGLPWVAVNVSPIQFGNPRFAQNVFAILRATGLPPNRLQLEITEGVLLENTGLIERTLEDLRRAGVRIALDDFGTGYSSMSYLRRYAIDKLKIDRSFVAELGISADADAIVAAMIGLARSLRLQVTAEGIETREQRALLASLGCQELQGFLLSRPVGEREMLDALRDANYAISA